MDDINSYFTDNENALPSYYTSKSQPPVSAPKSPARQPLAAAGSARVLRDTPTRRARASQASTAPSMDDSSNNGDSCVASPAVRKRTTRDRRTASPSAIAALARLLADDSDMEEADKSCCSSSSGGGSGSGSGHHNNHIDVLPSVGAMLTEQADVAPPVVPPPVHAAVAPLPGEDEMALHPSPPTPPPQQQPQSADDAQTNVDTGVLAEPRTPEAADMVLHEMMVDDGEVSFVVGSAKRAPQGPSRSVMSLDSPSAADVTPLLASALASCEDESWAHSMLASTTASTEEMARAQAPTPVVAASPLHMLAVSHVSAGPWNASDILNVSVAADSMGRGPAHRQKTPARGILATGNNKDLAASLLAASAALGASSLSACDVSFTTTARRQRVIFGSPQAAEFHGEAPASSLTALKKSEVRQRFTMSPRVPFPSLEGVEEPGVRTPASEDSADESEETAINSNILAQFEDEAEELESNEVSKKRARSKRRASASSAAGRTAAGDTSSDDEEGDADLERDAQAHPDSPLPQPPSAKRSRRDSIMHARVVLDDILNIAPDVDVANTQAPTIRQALELPASPMPATISASPARSVRTPIAHDRTASSACMAALDLDTDMDAAAATNTLAAPVCDVPSMPPTAVQDEPSLAEACAHEQLVSADGGDVGSVPASPARSSRFARVKDTPTRLTRSSASRRSARHTPTFETEPASEPQPEPQPEPEHAFITTMEVGLAAAVPTSSAVMPPRAPVTPSRKAASQVAAAANAADTPSGALRRSPRLRAQSPASKSTPTVLAAQLEPTSGSSNVPTITVETEGHAATASSAVLHPGGSLSPPPQSQDLHRRGGIARMAAARRRVTMAGLPKGPLLAASTVVNAKPATAAGTTLVAPLAAVLEEAAPAPLFSSMVSVIPTSAASPVLMRSTIAAAGERMSLLDMEVDAQPSVAPHNTSGGTVDGSRFTSAPPSADRTANTAQMAALFDAMDDSRTTMRTSLSHSIFSLPPPRRSGARAVAAVADAPATVSTTMDVSRDSALARARMPEGELDVSDVPSQHHVSMSMLEPGAQSLLSMDMSPAASLLARAAHVLEDTPMDGMRLSRVSEDAMSVSSASDASSDAVATGSCISRTSDASRTVQLPANMAQLLQAEWNRDMLHSARDAAEVDAAAAAAHNVTRASAASATPHSGCIAAADENMTVALPADLHALLAAEGVALRATAPMWPAGVAPAATPTSCAGANVTAHSRASNAADVTVSLPGNLRDLLAAEMMMRGADATSYEPSPIANDTSDVVPQHHRPVHAPIPPASPTISARVEAGVHAGSGAAAMPEVAVVSAGEASTPLRLPSTRALHTPTSTRRGTPGNRRAGSVDIGVGTVTASAATPVAALEAEERAMLLSCGVTPRRALLLQQQQQQQQLAPTVGTQAVAPPLAVATVRSPHAPLQYRSSDGVSCGTSPTLPHALVRAAATPLLLKKTAFTSSSHADASSNALSGPILLPPHSDVLAKATEEASSLLTPSVVLPSKTPTRALLEAAIARSSRKAFTPRAAMSASKPSAALRRILDAEAPTLSFDALCDLAGVRFVSSSFTTANTSAQLLQGVIERAESAAHAAMAEAGASAPRKQPVAKEEDSCMESDDDTLPPLIGEFKSVPASKTHRGSAAAGATRRVSSIRMLARKSMAPAALVTAAAVQPARAASLAAAPVTAYLTSAACLRPELQAMRWAVAAIRAAVEAQRPGVEAEIAAACGGGEQQATQPFVFSAIWRAAEIIRTKTLDDDAGISDEQMADAEELLLRVGALKAHHETEARTAWLSWRHKILLVLESELKAQTQLLATRSVALDACAAQSCGLSSRVRALTAQLRQRNVAAHALAALVPELETTLAAARKAASDAAAAQAAYDAGMQHLQALEAHYEAVSEAVALEEAALHAEMSSAQDAFAAEQRRKAAGVMDAHLAASLTAASRAQSAYRCAVAEVAAGWSVLGVQHDAEDPAMRCVTLKYLHADGSHHIATVSVPDQHQQQQQTSCAKSGNGAQLLRLEHVTSGASDATMAWPTVSGIPTFYHNAVARCTALVRMYARTRVTDARLDSAAALPVGAALRGAACAFRDIAALCDALAKLRTEHAIRAVSASAPAVASAPFKASGDAAAPGLPRLFLAFDVSHPHTRVKFRVTADVSATWDNAVTPASASTATGSALLRRPAGVGAAYREHVRWPLELLHIVGGAAAGRDTLTAMQRIIDSTPSYDANSAKLAALLAACASSAAKAV